MGTDKLEVKVVREINLEVGDFFHAQLQLHGLLTEFVGEVTELNRLGKIGYRSKRYGTGAELNLTPDAAYRPRTGETFVKEGSEGIGDLLALAFDTNKQFSEEKIDKEDNKDRLPGFGFGDLPREIGRIPKSE